MIPPSTGFPPVGRDDARVLVLGSLPGQASLRAAQYYAQPRNAFWPIMGELFGASPGLPYAERLHRLESCGIALWDVCASAERPGSLDGSIRPASVAVNDFPAWFVAHPRVAVVCFNGQKAAELYRRRVLPDLDETRRALRQVILPSTSPAYAAMRWAAKLDRWAILRRECSRATGLTRLPNDTG